MNGTITITPAVLSGQLSGMQQKSMMANLEN